MATKLKTGNIAADQLESLLQRIERLEEEKKALADDIKEVYAEAKAHGYNTKIMRQIVKLRAMDAAERAEQEALLDTYKHALGMLSDTPLGEAAVQQMKDAEPARRMARAAGKATKGASVATEEDWGEAIIAAGGEKVGPGEYRIELRNEGLSHDPETGEIDDADDEKDPGFAPAAEPAALHANTGGVDLTDIPAFLRRC